MGCCVSTANSTMESCRNGVGPPESPPLPPLEEETVKQVVLSETPMPKPSPLNHQEKMNDKTLVQEAKTDSTAVVINATIEPTPVIKLTEEIVSEVSADHSEMPSFTESFSTATAQEKIDDDDEVTQKHPAWVPRREQHSNKVTARKERRLRSPARLAAENSKGQLISQSEILERNLAARGRNVGQARDHRRDTSEGSVRKSRSPLKRGEVGIGKNGRHKSPGPSGAGMAGGGSPARTVNSSVDREGRPANDDNNLVENENDESLENSVVSLECFIFL